MNDVFDVALIDSFFVLMQKTLKGLAGLVNDKDLLLIGQGNLAVWYYKGRKQGMRFPAVFTLKSLDIQDSGMMSQFNVAVICPKPDESPCFFTGRALKGMDLDQAKDVIIEGLKAYKLWKLLAFLYKNCYHNLVSVGSTHARGMRQDVLAGMGSCLFFYSPSL